jgi:methyl-accepting chemotaxis protein
MDRSRTADDVLAGLIVFLLLCLASSIAAGWFALLRAKAPAELLVTMEWVFGGVAAGAALGALLLRSAIRKAAQRPIRSATEVVERVAAGDLTVNAHSAMNQVHTRRLMKALDGMTTVLREVVTEVVHSAHAVASRSGELARGHSDLARRTEEEASALQQTASSLEELTSTVAQNADSARKASQVAAEAREVALKGGELVGQVVATMNGIAESSHRVSDIIATIDGIAFQTNILALNAAVEAARAGEEGRGFAVVAAEVRALAQRSATAAREIKALIAESVGKVEAGAQLVDSAGRTMSGIVASITTVSRLISDIALASSEQNDGLAQVNTAVAQMDQVVQQNAALVDRAHAATQDMDQRAEHLLGLVSRFQLERGAGARTSSMTASPAPRLSAGDGAGLLASAA